MAALLLGLVDDDAELQPVRKLGASLLARLPPDDHLRRAVAQIDALAAAPAAECTSPASSLALYYVCCAVTLHPAPRRRADRRRTDGGALPDTLLGACAPAAAAGRRPLQRVQLGCIECLGRLAAAELAAATAAAAVAPRRRPGPPRRRRGR